MAEKIQVVGASIREIDKQIVEDYAKLHDLSFSAALRVIIRQWNEEYTRQQQASEQKAEYHA